MALGARDTRDLATPTNVDLEALNAYRTADGIGLGELQGLVQAGLTQFNGLAWGDAFAKFVEVFRYLRSPKQTASEAEIKYRLGNVTANDYTETGQEPLQRRSDAGAMVKTYKKTNAIGYTLQDLRRETAASILSDIGAQCDGMKEAVRQAFLNRIFASVTALTVGTSGKSPGWVAPSGTYASASQTYVSPNYNGTEFAAATHNHLDRQADDAAGRRAGFANFKTRILEHGYESVPGGPIMLLHGPLTTADVAADVNYVGRGNADFIRYASTTTLAEVPAWVHGILSDSRAWCVEMGGIPDNYFAAVKSFGVDAVDNPVIWWEPEDAAFRGLTLLGIDPNPPQGFSPWQRVQLYLEFGHAIARPDAGAVLRIAGSGNYTDPTIS